MTIHGRENRRRAMRLVLLFSILITFIFSACSSSPVVETVTTDAGRESALPPGAKPLAVEPNLPAPDPDIETAGDRIAETITHLNTPPRDRRGTTPRAP